MFCPNCGKPAEDGSRFCPNCGAAFADAVEEKNAPVEEAVTETPAGEAPAAAHVEEAAELAEAVVAEDTDVTEAETVEPVENAAEIAEAVIAEDAEPEQPEAPVSCPVCGAAPETGSQTCPACGAEIPAAPKKKSKAWLWVTIAAAAVVLCVVLVLCLLPKSGPFDKLGEACVNTFTAPSSAGTLTIRSDGKDYAVIDFTLVPDLRNPTFIISNQGTTIALYQHHLLTNIPGYGTFKQDMSEKFKEYLDALDQYEASKDEPQDFDLEELDIRTFLQEIDETGELLAQLEEGMDIDVLNQCLRELPEHFEDEDWLKDAVNYTESKDGKAVTYGFSINADSIGKFVELFRPAFRNQEDYAEAMDELAQLTEEKLNLALTFTTESSYLTTLGLNAAVDGNSMEFVVEFSEISQTPYDTTQLDQWLAEAQG